MNSELSRMKRQARYEFDKWGKITYFTAKRLMELGCMVQQMEDQWMRGAE